MAKAQAVQKFSVNTWRSELDASALSFTTAAAHILRLVIQARGVVEVDTAKEAIQHSFATAYAQANRLEFDAACKAKSVQNRVSDAMAVFRCESLPAELPSNLQQAAAAVRKASPKAKRAPRQPVASSEGPELAVVNVQGSQLDAVSLLELAIEGLVKLAGDNETSLVLLGELKDLALDLTDALKNQ